MQIQPQPRRFCRHFLHSAITFYISSIGFAVRGFAEGRASWGSPEAPPHSGWGAAPHEVKSAESLSFCGFPEDDNMLDAHGFVPYSE